MSVFDAHALPAPARAPHLEALARLRDVVTRQADGAGRRLEGLLERLERALDDGPSIRRVRQRLALLRDWLRSDRDALPRDELALLLERVLEHPGEPIERYADFLFSVDVRL